MSKYTTGEVAKLCGVTVRTVQYYDARGILVPAELSEGGRRLYSEEDVRRMKVICFLRDLGLPIDSISGLLSEEDPGSVIALLLERQRQTLRGELAERREKLEKLEELQRELKNVPEFSVDSIGDIAYTMTGKEKVKKIHKNLLLGGIPATALFWVALILTVTKGMGWLWIVWAAVAVPYGILASRYYWKNTAYLCPQCHEVFRPSFKEAFFAKHTPSTRKLTCTSCGHHGFCVEVSAEDLAVGAKKAAEKPAAKEDAK